MPDSTPRRRAFIWGTIFALGLVVAALSVIGFVLQRQLRDARERVAAIETGTKIGEVATCFAAARTRPQLIVILRGMAVKLDPDPRDATLNFIDAYERQTPTLPECAKRAREARLDPRDFPPVNRGQKGNGR
jgi:hypothetical protein